MGRTHLALKNYNIVTVTHNPLSGNSYDLFGNLKKEVGDMIGLFLFKVGDIHFRQLQMDGIFFFLALSVFSTTKRGIGVLDL